MHLITVFKKYPPIPSSHPPYLYIDSIFMPLSNGHHPGDMSVHLGVQKAVLLLCTSTEIQQYTHVCCVFLALG